MRRAADARDAAGITRAKRGPASRSTHQRSMDLTLMKRR
jgi:hypothetical protein